MIPMIKGTPVIVWTRVRDDVIVLLAEGNYDGTTFFNAKDWPVVRLNDGREVTVHTLGIEVGKRESVVKTCEEFKKRGVVISFDIARYLNGERPDLTQYHRTTVGAPPTATPHTEPKTVTDKLMVLRDEIKYERNKIAAAQAVIDDAEKKVQEKYAKMIELRSAVMAELEAIDSNVRADSVPVVVPTVAPLVVTDERDLPNFDEEANRAAVED
jgi:hypothetical protein